MSGLNIWLLTPEDLVRYVEPETDTEKALYAALKYQLEKSDIVDEETEAELCELQKTNDKLASRLEEIEHGPMDYPQFFKYVSEACARNDSWAVAIYEHITKGITK